MIQLSVCIPTTGFSRAEHAMSLANFCLYFMQEPVAPGEPQSIVLRHYQSSSIQNGREWLVRQSLADGATHVLFIDEDVAFEVDAPYFLLRRQHPLVACNYKMRYEGMPFAAFSPDGERRIVTTAASPPTEEISASGFGLALIAREVFETVPQPWFPTPWCESTGTYSTEDVPFFLKARAAGFTPWVDHEASRRITHIGSYRYRWDDPRDPPSPSPALE